MRSIRPAPVVFWAAAAATMLAALWLNLAHLGASTWRFDELVYRDAGWSYVHGDLTPNREHPPLGKYLVGIAELVVGRDTGIRIVAVVASLATAVVLAAFAWRLAGRVAALGTFAAWTLLPHAVQGGVIRLDRLLFLDPLMAAFAAGALYAAYRQRPAVAGALLGAAVATKVPGALYLPAVLMLAWPAWRRVLGLAATVVAIAYAPYGTNALAALRYMVDFQSNASARGHAVLVDGHPYLHAPWWSHLSWQWDAYAGIGFVVLVGAAVAAVLLLPDRRTPVALGLAVLVPFVALSVHGVKLPYYYYDWQPPLTLLAVLGLVLLARRQPTWAVLAALGTAALAALVGLASFRVATLHRSDYALLGRVVPAHATVTVWGFAPVATAYLPGRHVTAATPATVRAADVVVVDQRQARADPQPALSQAIRAGHWTAASLDGGLTVYQRH